jgi:hypothetical protein
VNAEGKVQNANRKTGGIDFVAETARGLLSTEIHLTSRDASSGKRSATEIEGFGAKRQRMGTPRPRGLGQADDCPTSLNH